MKTFWLIAAVVLVLGLVAMLWPDPARRAAEERAAALATVAPVQTAPPGPATLATPIEPVPTAFGDVLSGAQTDVTARVEQVFEPIAVTSNQATPSAAGSATNAATEDTRLADAIEAALSDAPAPAPGDAPPTNPEHATPSPGDADAPWLAAAAPTAPPAHPDPIGTLPTLDEMLGADADAPATALAPSEPTPTDPSPAANTVERRDDGSLLVDGRFEVPGAGTPESPFLMPWDVLISTQRVYRPREGLDTLPAWTEPADGKPVEITGYVAFPFMAASADECLLMLNQWDGCCLGVPPTPYDAVEVRLAGPVDTRGGMLNHGTLRGTLRVDPYVMNGWLVGLYVLEDARFVEADRRGQMPPHEPR